MAFVAHVPTSNRVVGLYVAPAGKENDFGEDVGTIVAVDAAGKVAAINVEKMLRSLGLKLTAMEDSALGKLALLKQMQDAKLFSQATVVTEGSFKEPGKGAGPTSFGDIFFEEHAMSQRLVSSNTLNLGSVRIETALLRDSSSKDLKIAYALYDKIRSIFSYTMNGRNPILGPNTYFQIIPNGIPISLQSLKEKPPVSPLNPNGDLRTSEEFADVASFSFDPSGKLNDQNVERAFGLIINSVNSSQAPDEQALKVLEKVRKYLWVKVKDPFTEEITEQKSPAWRAYIEANNKLQLALANFISKRNLHDLSTPEGQRAWQAESLVLQAKIDALQDEVDSHVTVKKALQYLKVYGNNAVQNAIAQAKDRFNKSAVPSLFNVGSKFHVSYGLPSNWYEQDDGFSGVKISTKDFSSEYSHAATSYGGGGRYYGGFFSVGGSFRSSREETRHHTDSSAFDIDFKLGTIPIQRPWMDTTLFGLEKWNFGGQPAGKISSGLPPIDDARLNERALPYYSTALVVAKDISVSGNWGSSDLRILKTSTTASTSVRCGPFTLGGANYTRTTENRSFNSTENNGTFTVPGAQIIGVINQIVPFSAPEAG